MNGVYAALWGLFGGFAVEGLDLYTAVRRFGRWPWRVREPREAGPVAYAVAELVRLAIGGGLAAATAVSGQITSPAGALAVGVAAPLIVERLTRAVPLADSVSAAVAQPGCEPVAASIDGQPPVSQAAAVVFTTAVEGRSESQTAPVGE
jgi:hypothetical protein